MKYPLFGALLLISFLGATQDVKLGNWINYFGNKKLTGGFNWHHEVQYRNYNFVGDLEQLLLRTGVGYDFSESNHNLLLGYGFIYSENYTGPDEKASVAEHRIFQQYLYKQLLGRLALQHRLRFEQRFVASGFRLRYRYFLGANIPLNTPEMQAGTLYLSAYNEFL